MNTNITTTPHLPYEKIKLDECHICLEYLVGEIAEVSCGHIYHLKCIQDWISKKGTHKCCCICDGNTEIVNIVNLPDSKIKSPLPNNTNINEVNQLPILQHSDHPTPGYQNRRRNDMINQRNNQGNNQRIREKRCCQIL